MEHVEEASVLGPVHQGGLRPGETPGDAPHLELPDDEQRVQQESSITRENLMEQGFSPTEADVMAVRLHEEEVLMEHFRQCICVFLCFMYTLTPVMFGLLAWLVVSLCLDQEDCDMPLKIWTYVVIAVAVYNMTLNRHTLKGSIIVRTCCCWSRDPVNPQPVPWRVRAYTNCLTVAIVSWNLLGLHWVGRSGKADTELPACTEVAPGLHAAVKVYASASVAFTFFMTLFMVGFNRFMREVMYRGLLNSSKAAPKGALDKSTSEVVEDDLTKCSHSKCPVCLEDFGELALIRKTNACNHYFHKRCLQGW
eukprot:CAMPEP_0170573712 /NCGR_PEP_ID=MMETSP0224-20130122/2909_1 /TAXON_ID=285029 /ORGANISM="Togula jolla, Strain CCCM 725" /LENGTH=307 /DNA_ID=CAMNT_0010896313 /DNA_START=49 /DNA_END=969 /DNA_ORIENTATION=-